MLNLTFDHLGIIVKSIDKAIPLYLALGYTIDSEVFCDEQQQMRGIFLEKLGEPRVELIEDLSASKALTKMINTPCGRIYHLAYRVQNLAENLDEILNRLNARLLSPIKDGSYFKKVCFVFSSDMQILELVECK
ncbi:MAG: VOC family protein [bacterium]